MDSKQRSFLSALAGKTEAAFQIGKGNLSENLIKSLDNYLEANELLKVSVQKGADFSAKELLEQLCAALGAEPVRAIGNRLIIYRRSKKQDIKHLL